MLHVMLEAFGFLDSNLILGYLLDMSCYGVGTLQDDCDMKPPSLYPENAVLIMYYGSYITCEGCTD